MKKGGFFSGTSGIVLPVRNKTEFPVAYQHKSRLTYYSSLFNSVEINSSFYKLPQAATIQKWADSVEGDFKFTFKLWRNITHNKNLSFDVNDVDKFMEVVNAAGDKKGCLLLQFPAGTRADNTHQFGYLLTEIEKRNINNEWQIVVEFRHNSWYNADCYTLLNKYKALVVLHDMPKSATPLNAGTATEVIYLRFHGTGGKYGGSYTGDFLHEYAALIKEWQVEGKTVYTYFNNTMGDAVRNLISLNKFIG